MLKNPLKKIENETKVWTFAAWVAPFVALFSMVVLEYLGLETIKQNISIIIAVIFFAVSVFWWWWVMAKVRQMFGFVDEQMQTFNEIKKDIKETKELINDLDPRKRRE